MTDQPQPVDLEGADEAAERLEFERNNLTETEQECGAVRDIATVLESRAAMRSELVRLREENARLRKALESLIDTNESLEVPSYATLTRLRAALSQEVS